MVYEMKLKDMPFNMIKAGKKTVELRLYDDKRRKLSVGDKILFTNLSTHDEKIAVTIKALYRFGSFRELFEEISLERCGFSCDISIDEAVEEMRNYYSAEAEHRYGVLGINVEITDLQSVMIENEQMKIAYYEHFFPDGMK